ncbi:MAG: FeoA domain-containing protein [Halobacteriovoraceae bacterium]|nr:FeoA domain-containing protein [Halobacteriovoraceae bacterium]MCB9093803.1 FeoA domain-containing protein [Halobacteriovoraceae bacterium]
MSNSKKLSDFKENSVVIISSEQEIPLKLSQQGLIAGEKVRIIQNKRGCPILLELRTVRLGIKRRDANQLFASLETP